MPKTRRSKLSVEEGTAAQLPDEQLEAASEETPVEDASESKPEKSEDGAASKARERQERFKALQSRAVSHLSTWTIIRRVSRKLIQRIEIRC